MANIVFADSFENEMKISVTGSSGVSRNFVGGGGGEGVQQIQLRTEDKENGDLGAVAP